MLTAVALPLANCTVKLDSSDSEIKRGAQAQHKDFPLLLEDNAAVEVIPIRYAHS